MKKILSILLTLTLVIGCSTTVFAETSTEAGSQSQDVYGTFVAGTKTSTIFTVDIEWSAMDFTYYEANEPVWDPETHTYSNVEEYGEHWEGEGTITVTNHSNTAIKAVSKYTGLEGYKTAGLEFNNKEVYLESAEIGNEAKEEVITVTPYGTLPVLNEKTKIGTITVELSEFEVADNREELLVDIQDLNNNLQAVRNNIDYQISEGALVVDDASTVPSGTAYITNAARATLASAITATDEYNEQLQTMTVEELQSLYVLAYGVMRNSNIITKG